MDNFLHNRVTSKMRICHITDLLPGYHDNWGGAEMACYRTAKLEKENKQEVSVLSTNPLKDANEFNFYTISTIEDYIGFLGYYKFAFPYDIISYFSLKKTLRRIKPDVIHLHNFKRISFAAVKAAKKLNIPIVFSIYDYWAFCPVENLINYKNDNCRRFQGKWCRECLKYRKFAILQSFFVRYRKRYFGRYLNKINKFIVLSNPSKRLLESYGIYEERIKTIPLPVDMDTPNEDAPKQGKIERNSILYAAWIQHRKGLHVLIKAMPDILKEFPNARLYVIGIEGPEKKYKKGIIELIKKNNIEKKVFFLKKVSDSELKSFLKKANIVAVPEQWENMSPLIIMEAMAYAKPIVASNIGGIPDFIIHKKTGLLANHKKPEDFADRVITLLKNERYAKKLGMNAQRRFKQIFNDKQIIEILLNAYKSAINYEK